jgi:hypothetical protein
MVLFAIVSGGDYTDGLYGAGPRLACALSHYDMGDRLFTAARSFPPEELLTFLQEWRADFIKTLKDDPLGVLPGSRLTVARVVVDTFPEVDTVLKYTNPLTSWSNSGNTPFNRSSITIRQPDLVAVAKISADNFSWGTCEGIMKTFRRNLWGNCFVQSLYCNLINCETSLDTPLLVSRFRGSGKHCDFLLTLTFPGSRSLPQNHPSHPSSPSACLPRLVLPCTLLFFHTISLCGGPRCTC